MENINVFVVGRLGEVVKKTVELEMLLEKEPGNHIAVVELASYSQVLSSWPLEKPDMVTNLVMDFRLALHRYAVANEEFMQSVASKNTLRLEIDSLAYLKQREIVKAKLKHLNALGRYVGDVPLMNMSFTK